MKGYVLDRCLVGTSKTLTISLNEVSDNDMTICYHMTRVPQWSHIDDIAMSTQLSKFHLLLKRDLSDHMENSIAHN